MYQKTIEKDLFFEGIGVHSGLKSSIILKPLDVDTGIIFIKDNEKITLDLKNIVPSQLCTKISKNNISISTIEHILSSIYALEITNIEIHIDGDEIPIIDGCTYTFTHNLSKFVKTQNKKSEIINLNKTIIYNNNDKFLIAIPSNELEINYYIDYQNKLPYFMYYKYIHSSENYIKDISKARTFGYKDDLEFLKNKGLANGANLKNTLVIEKNEYLSTLNYYNEPVRHKILDLIGDLSFLNKKLNAKIFAYKTGHKEHLEFVEKIITFYS